MLRGDFTPMMSAACRGGTARTLGAPFVKNQVDPGLFHPLSLKILSMVSVSDPALDPDDRERYLSNQCGCRITPNCTGST
jgi:hypothetical protein